MRGRDASPSPLSGRGLFTRLVNAIGTIDFGIILLVSILIYCWIGSAGFAPLSGWFPRQSCEKTEMEWFAWWPFGVLLALLSLSLILVTVRRIPLRWENAGVWMVHAGVLVLVAGGAVYFGQKMEGSMLIYRREAVVRSGSGEPVVMVLQPEAEATVQGRDRHYDLRVVDLHPDYSISAGGAQEEKAYAAQILVEPRFPDGSPGKPFVRQVVVGYPEYTEDVLPGEGRATKVLGRALVDEELTIELRYAATDRMALRDRYAIHARVPGAKEWTEFPLRGLPHYTERFARSEDVWVEAGERPFRPRPLDIRPRPGENLGGLDPAFSVRVIGYLPYARLEEHWASGGDSLNPYLRFTTRVGENVTTGELLAFDRERSRLALDFFDISFRWITDRSELDRLLNPPPARLLVRVKGGQMPVVVPLDQALKGEVEIPGTGYRLHGEQVFPHWSLAAAGRTGEPASMALVKISGPRGTFTRAVVSPQVELSQDLDAQGMRHRDLLDDGIQIELENLSAEGLLLVAGPVGLHGILTSQDGEVMHREAVRGEPFGFFDDHVQVTIDELWENACAVRQPTIVPLRERERKAGPMASLVQVEVSQGNWRESRWLPFSAYAFPNRLGYFPSTVSLPDGRSVEIAYSEETYQLPTSAALEEFVLETFPGQTRERDYISMVRFFANGQWGPLREVHSNNPVKEEGWWYFQSTWDPPEPDMNYAGMNYTGLGVGNRRGVGVMFWGALMTVVGTLFAFYVKPVIRRRRARIPAGAAGDLGRPGRAVCAGHGGGYRGLALVLVGSIALGLPLAKAYGATADAATAQAASGWAAESPIALSVSREFAAAVDLHAIRLVGVQDEGRVKTFDSLAREKLKFVNSSRAARRMDPVLLYLDMMLAPEHYAGADVVYIKKPPVRQAIVRKVRGLVGPGRRQGPIRDAELDRVEATGLVSLDFLDDPVVRSVLADLERDVMRTSKEIQALYSARMVADAAWLLDAWRVIPPPGATPIQAWYPLDAAWSAAPSAHGMPGGMARGVGVPGLSREVALALATSWEGLARAWREQDAPAASQALRDLASALPGIEPALYPSAARLRWEHWYYRHQKLTATWILYFLALPFLLMAVVYRLRWARVAGLVLFGLGFALHSLSVGLRWYLAGRIPNANMFEAILASAWFGCLAAVVLETVLRGKRMKNLAALAASTYAAAALMCGHFMPIRLNSDITTVMPVLDRTIWLYIHTNMIIASYALLFFAAVTAALYLVGRGTYRLHRSGRLAALWRGEGAGEGESGGLATSLDGATMIFLELAFITLWLGTLLGAVWADVSWGRPWGWDPKEVFALNTWLVLLILVHLRLKVADKALWSAVLALVACGVMLFNWIAVNFVITGLHSYA